MTIPPGLIRRQGALLQDYAHTQKRAKELAHEVDRLNRIVAELADGIAFEDEPSRYLVALAKGKKAAGGAKR
jgi:hypothetical protein